MIAGPDAPHRPAAWRRWWRARAVGLALLAYPRPFRRRFGEEMRRDFARLLESEPDHTIGRRAVRRLLAFAGQGLAERLVALRRYLVAPGGASTLYGFDRPQGDPEMTLSLDSLRADLRQAARRAARAPWSTALVVLTLALGIGASTAILTVVEGVLLEPLPYRAPDRLTMVWSHATFDGRPRNPLSPADFRDLAAGQESFEGLEAFFSFVTRQELATPAGTEVAYSVVVTPGLFGLLGREPALGRPLRPEDGAAAVLLADGYWRRRFGADPAIVGRSLRLDGEDRVVAGVMPPDFVFPYGPMLGPSGFSRTTAVDLWTPLVWSGPQARAHRILTPAGDLVREVRWLGAVGRLRPGVTREDAASDLGAIARRLEQQHPESNRGWGVTLVPAREQVVGAVRPALLTLAAGVGLVLLMATVNVANITLVRGLARQCEWATRVALGGSRRRLAGQAISESLLLALAAGVVGTGVAWLGVRGLVALAPASLPRLGEIAPDGTVLLVALLASGLAGLGAGILPAVAATRAEPQAALREAGRGSAGASRGSRRWRSGLIIAEVALAVVLVSGAGLLLRSFAALMALDPGFRSDRLLSWQMSLPDRVRSAEERRAFYATFFERMRGLPGVVSVGGTTRLPLGSTSVSTTVEVEGRARPVGEMPEVQLRRSLADYFATMEIPLRRGRLFTAEDGPSAAGVVLVNETFAARLFPGEDPLGRRVRLGANPAAPLFEIVGVVGDIRHQALETPPEAEIYVNYLQNPPVAPFIVLRTQGDPAALADAVRREAAALDPDLPIHDLRTMAAVRASAVEGRRFVLHLVTGFGLLALLLAGVGVFGVLATAVQERTREVGVRVALGASPGAVLAMVAGQAARWTLWGLAAGLVVTAALGPLLRQQLFGVAPGDPATLVGASLVILLASSIAAIAPTRHALRCEPARVLREE